MAADRRRFVWGNAVLTVLVALALLFAPAARVQAMQCHERPVNEHSGFENASIHADVHASSKGGLHTAGHKSCCVVPCSFCVVLTNMDRPEGPAAIGSFLRFAWRDQTGHGLVLAPTLGPPRFPV